ncbi:MAG: DUF4136 domain-containing protein [Desulfuromonadaceae bacterium]
MKRMRWLGVGIGLLVVLTACAPKLASKNTFDGRADFQQYHSWFWSDGKPALVDAMVGADLNEQFIRRAIADELVAKGLAIQAGQPDLLVRYETHFQEAVSATPSETGYSYQWRWVRWAFGESEQQSYSKGTLIIDMLDRKTGNLVWQGSVSGPIRDKTDAQGKLRAAVKEVLAPYPPAP